MPLSFLGNTNHKVDFYIKSQKDKREFLGYYDEKTEFLLKEVGEKKRVLDIGCNDGFIGELLLKKGNEVFGIDIVKKNLKTAQGRGLIVKLVDVEKEKLPFRKNYFDVVILGDILEHVFDTDMLIQKCKSVLKPCGKLIITTPNVASVGRRLMLLFGISPFLEYSLEMVTNGLPSVGHIRYYTVDTLKKQLEHNGLEVLKIQGSVLNLLFFCTHLLDKIGQDETILVYDAYVYRHEKEVNYKCLSF